MLLFVCYFILLCLNFEILLFGYFGFLVFLSRRILFYFMNIITSLERIKMLLLGNMSSFVGSQNRMKGDNIKEENCCDIFLRR